MDGDQESGDKTEGAVESKSLSRRPMDIWISVFGTERLQEPDGSGIQIS